jgi:hypothetical protein
VAGNHAGGQETCFDVPEDSPLITSLVFLPWQIRAAGTPTRIARSSAVGSLLLGTRRSTDAELLALRARPFISSELRAGALSNIAHAIDVAKGFDVVYLSFEAWESALPDLLSKVPVAAPLRLEDAFFYNTTPLGQGGSDEVRFLEKVSIGSLLSASDGLSNSSYGAGALARATLLFGWKDTNAVRGDEDSDVRVVSDRIQRLCRRRMHDPSGDPTDGALARELCMLMSDPQLPLAFSNMRVSPLQACGELETAYNYWNADSAACRAIEAARFLGVPKEFTHLRPIISLFTIPTMHTPRLSAWPHPFCLRG